MKTKFFTIIMLAFALVSNASDMPTVSNEKSKTLIVNTQNWKGGSLDISIVDQNDNIVHQESIKNEKNGRSYNVKNLADGVYAIKMSNGLKVTKQPFEIISGAVFLNKEIEITYIPVINFKDMLINVNALSVDSQTSISIYDEKNNILINEKIEGTTIHRRYNVSKLEPAFYTVHVTTGGIITSKTIQKK
jgi:hypothetical protein